MSEFLKLAFELIAKIIYNLAEWVVGFVNGFLKLFITGWPEYVMIFRSYFGTLSIIGKALSVLLVILLISIPVLIVVIIIRHIILNIRLRADSDDNAVLYKEIGRLNKQVLELMDEKNKILALKVNNIGNIEPVPYNGQEGLLDYTTGESGVVYDSEGGSALGGIAAGDPAAGDMIRGGTGVYSGTGMPAAGGVGFADPMAATVSTGGVIGAITGGAALGDDALANAAAAAATAAEQAKSKASELERINAARFPKLSLVDTRYEDFERPDYNEDISLQEFVKSYRLFAASQMKLYYTEEIVRRFVAGMASSKILILEGISGTGKTSLPYSFSRFLGNPATIVPVQPSFRDRSELLGYFNEFSKRFNETEFLRALYEAGYREDPSLIVLDEMNLARIEYYFAEMLSILEMPNKDEWVIDLVPTAWPGDPQLLDGGKLHVSPNTWFVGTANSDDSTFTITDKVYDRAMPIELNERAAPFECELEPRRPVTCDHLRELFETAKDEHPISEATMANMVKVDSYLQTRFKLAFGNRIIKQMYDFIPVYVACGGTELGGLDYILARKVLKKFESLNVTFVRDEIKGLITYLEKTFGKGAMHDSIEYLTRIQNLY
ncbi:MAG: hypothetical protein PUC98_06510 [Clostridiales bacterium]|nr:hypothetical protein [Clostridiales bacterium]